MLGSLLRNNFRAQLIVPVAITLLLMITSAVVFTIVGQKKTSSALNQKVEDAFTEVSLSIGRDLGGLAVDFDLALSKMQTQVSTALAQSSSRTLKKAASSMRMGLQKMSKQNGEDLINLLSLSAVSAVLAKDYAALNGYVRGAHQNKNVVFLFYRDSSGKPLTRYLNRKNPVLKTYLPKGRPDIDEIIQKGDEDSNVVVLNRAVFSEGDVIGSVTVGLDISETIEHTKIISEQFDELVKDNSENIDTLLGKEATTLNTHLQSVVKNIQKGISDRSVKTVKEVQESGDQVSQRTRNLFIVGSVAGFIMVLSSLFFNARSVLRLLGGQPAAMVEFARSVAAGDLSVKGKGAGFQGSLQEALMQMSDRLRDLIGNIVTEGRNMQTTSAELAIAADELAGGAEQSASRSDAVAAATAEMSSKMVLVTSSSEQAAENVNVVAMAMEELAEAGRNVARNTAKASGMTEKAVEYAVGSSEKVNQLGDAAREINKVTEVITEISEQTNLLALNATIEAARAGDAGKGFAVVANEIKDLAKQTSEATGEIKARIETIQSSTDETVNEISKISEVINSVNELVGTIATAAEDQSVTVNDVSGNVTEASTGIHEVNENVAQASVVASEIARDIATVSLVSGEAKERSQRLQESSNALKRVAERINTDTNYFTLDAG